MSAPRKIAVAGATGRVGRHLVDILEAQGHEVAAMSRSRGVDVITGEGLAEAVAGADAIVDAATGPSPEEQAATEFFTAAARNLQEAGEQAGVQRIVVVSIIGSDRFTGGYGAAKVAHEQAMLVGPDPGARAARGAVPRVRRAAHGVGRAGRRDLRAEDAHAAGRRPDRRRGARRPRHRLERDRQAPILEIAGPREERLVEMATLLAARRGDAAPIEAPSDPADPDQACLASGGLLPGPDAILAGPTFEAWLDEAA